MMIEKIAFLNTFKERLLCYGVMVCIFLLTLSFQYVQYQDFIKEEFIKTEVSILNVYEKDDYNVLKLQAENFDVFTSVDKSFYPNIYARYEVIILTSSISFIEYIKGFYTKTMLYEPLSNKGLVQTLSLNIANQHENVVIQRLYQALFLAQPLPSSLRDYFANAGISHLIAISGFHLSVLSFCLYLILLFIYKPIHQHSLPFRNRRFDILVVVSLLLFMYLSLTGFVPSLLRAFIMMFIALLLLRHNISIFSYEILLLTFALIVALFPKYLFSIGLWFSIGAVFYIYLFLQYFQKGNKIILAIWFNVWIFMVFNPIVHFFFANTSYEQLLSPLITIVFTLFYPLSLMSHLIGFGNLLDSSLIFLLGYSIDSFEVMTPGWFFLLYLLVSFFAIWKKEAFISLNILMLLFNVYLFT